MLSTTHHLLGDVPKATVEMLSDYKRKTLEQLNDQTPELKDKCMPIEGLACYNGFCCLHVQCYIPLLEGGTFK